MTIETLREELEIAFWQNKKCKRKTRGVFNLVTNGGTYKITNVTYNEETGQIELQN